MSTLRRRKQLTTHLIRAVRGKRSPLAVDAQDSASASTTMVQPNKLPCFPLQRHHFGKMATTTTRVVGARNSGDVKSNATNIDGGRSNGDLPTVATPSDFHSYLCNSIRRARERIILASLYVGVGSNITRTLDRMDEVELTTGCKEDDLLQALQDASSKNNLKKVQILLDANRALRRVSVTSNQRQSHGSSSSHNTIQTNSAEAVFSSIGPYSESSASSNCDCRNGLFLFPVNDKRLCTVLPSPLDEVAGVFHIKAYIVDDELIVSGANLSEEYFTNRHDRYMLFTNGGGGLVDFYADLCDILCEYAIRYDGQSEERANNIDLSSLFSLQDEKTRKEKLELSLMHLFDGHRQSHALKDSSEEANAVAYAIPTFQMPTSFMGRSLRFRSDVEATRHLLHFAAKSAQSASVRLSSAYLNITPNLLSALSLYGKESGGAPYILTAGATSHGFAPKVNSQSSKNVGIVDKIKSTIPQAFLTLVKEAAQSMVSNGGKILLYDRTGWTFHAKGIWITENDDHDESSDGPGPEIINNPSSLVSTIIGSGNYGARSEDLDVESNCILIFNDSDDDNANEERDCTIKEHVAAEWNNMCTFSNEMTQDVESADADNKAIRFVLHLMKRFL